MDLQNLVLIIFASGSISHMQENANLSSLPRKEHRLELSNSKTRNNVLHSIYAA